MKRKLIVLLVALAALVFVPAAQAIVTPGPANQADHTLYPPTSTTYLHVGNAEEGAAHSVSFFNEGGNVVQKTPVDDCQWRVSDAAHGCVYTGTTSSVHNADGTVTVGIYGIAPAFRRYCFYTVKMAGTDSSMWYYQGNVTALWSCSTY